jgi:hypothetical protein
MTKRRAHAHMILHMRNSIPPKVTTRTPCVLRSWWKYIYKMDFNYILYLTSSIVSNIYIFHIIEFYFNHTYFCHAMVVAHGMNFPCFVFFSDNVYELLILYICINVCTINHWGHNSTATYTKIILIFFNNP